MQKSARMKRELQLLTQSPPHGISCWAKEDQLDKLEAQILGIEGTPYEGGLFKLEIQIPDRVLHRILKVAVQDSFLENSCSPSPENRSPNPTANYTDPDLPADLSLCSLLGVISRKNNIDPDLLAHLMLLDLTYKYPFEPPKVRFVTPIYHPNIDTGGRICLDTLKMPPKGAWKPCLNVSTVLTSIQLLMAEPNPEDPLMADISNEFKYNKAQFLQKAKEWTEIYAKEKKRKDCEDGKENERREKVFVINSDGLGSSAERLRSEGPVKDITNKKLQES